MTRDTRRKQSNIGCLLLLAILLACLLALAWGAWEDVRSEAPKVAQWRE